MTRLILTAAVLLFGGCLLGCHFHMHVGGKYYMGDPPAETVLEFPPADNGEADG